MEPKTDAKLSSLEGPKIPITMDLQAEKLLLIEQLLHIQDSRIIDQIHELLKKSYNPIVGYEENGRPVTHQDFIKQIEQAEKEFVMGNYQNIDEVEKESESW